MQADFLCPPCPLRPRLEVLSPLGGSPRPDPGCVCVCTRAHACVHGRSSEAEVRNASPTSPFRPGFSQCQRSGSLGLSPGAVGGWAGGGAFLAGATADSCAVSVPRARLCAASGPGARQLRYLVAGAAGRQGGWTGGMGWRERHKVPGAPWPVSVPLNVRPRTRVAWEQSQAVWGWQGEAWLRGPGAVPGPQRLLGYTCIHPHSAVGWLRVPLIYGFPLLAALLRQAMWGSPALCPLRPLCSLFPPLSSPPATTRGLSACARGLVSAAFLLPTAPPLRLCPLGLYLVLPTSVPLPPPTSPAEPFSLWNLSGSPYLCLSWPGLHVPVSPRACAWVGMGVSLEKSLSASRLQLQAGCHGNRVRGPRCNS